MNETTIPAITLTQPWASLVAVGAKHLETRGWYPRALRPGCRIAIHAAKGWTAEDRWLCTQEPFVSALRTAYRAGYFPFMDKPDSRLLPRGCVVALARYVRAHSTTTGELVFQLMLSDQERAFGNYAPGRWAWLLEDVRAIEPITVPGHLGIWPFAPPDTLTYLELQPPVLAAQEGARDG